MWQIDYRQILNTFGITFYFRKEMFLRCIKALATTIMVIKQRLFWKKSTEESKELLEVLPQPLITTKQKPQRNKLKKKRELTFIQNILLDTMFANVPIVFQNLSSSSRNFRNFYYITLSTFFCYFF